MLFFNVTYGKDSQKLVKKSIMQQSLGIVALIICLALAWVFAALIYDANHSLILDEWIMAGLITVIALSCILTYVITIVQNVKIVKILENSESFTTQTVRFGGVNSKGEFVSLYWTLMLILTIILGVMTVLTIILKAVENNLVSMFLAMLILLSVCGVNAVFNMHNNKKLNEIVKYEAITLKERINKK